MEVSVAEGTRGQDRDRAHFDGAEWPPWGVSLGHPLKAK